MILVIADDLSGAAEIAAVGWRFGLNAQVQTQFNPDVKADLVVVDINTRSMSDHAAYDICEAVANRIAHTDVQWCYKKVDSVLRGHICSELRAMMKVLQKPRVILAPANPSKGRTISHGRYLIDNQPLDETDFAHAPEHAAASCYVADLLNSSEGYPVHIVERDTYNGSEKGIIVAEAENRKDLSLWAECVDDNTLAAGGSDFFAAMLERRLSSNMAGPDQDIVSVHGKKLFVCGSVSDYSRRAVAQAGDSGFTVCPMPDSLFQSDRPDDALIKQWANDVLAALSTCVRVIVAIRQPVMQDVQITRDLRTRMAALVQMVLGRTRVHELFIEGGATAEAILHRMEWDTLNVLGEYRPGVVQMRVEGQQDQYITIKPGSYPWPDRIWNQS
ncbi:MAG: four-carbon acid sugar kinase family protein [Planctomycetota bacterium]|jgi:uncharacterized protein YgbK (DUF1537 family)